jgi:hypothetical protein
MITTRSGNRLDDWISNVQASDLPHLRAEWVAFPATGRQLLEPKEGPLADELRVFSTFVKDFTMYCVEDILRDGPEVAIIQFVRQQRDVNPPRSSNTGAPDGWISSPMPTRCPGSTAACTTRSHQCMLAQPVGRLPRPGSQTFLLPRSGHPDRPR